MLGANRSGEGVGVNPSHEAATKCPYMDVAITLNFKKSFFEKQIVKSSNFFNVERIDGLW